MGGTKGYRSYRGRTSKGKIALAVLLVLIILAAVGFLWLQEYICLLYTSSTWNRPHSASFRTWPR